MLKVVGTIGGAFRVEQQRKGRAGLFQPGACLISQSKRKHDDAGIQELDLGGVLAQLRHVLAAGQSTQMPEEDEQRGVPATPGFRQRNGLPIYRAQYEVRGWVTGT
jgi:hypothetical protein